jgi:hypothetical protein
LLQVYAKGELVGGSDSLLAKIADGSFQQLMSQSSSSTPSLPDLLSKAVQAAAAATPAAAPAAGTQLPEALQKLLAALSNPQSGLQRQPGSAGQPPSFTGKALLDWLMQHNGSSSDRSAAASQAQQLLSANAITLLSDKQPSAAEVAAVFDDEPHRYALCSEAVRAVPWGSALNTHFWWGPAAARPAEVVAEDLRARILALYDKHLSADGRAVSYAALKQDPEFWEYVDATAELQRVSLLTADTMRDAHYVLCNRD